MSSIIKYFQKIFDLKEEIEFKEPLIMLISNKELYLENHSGITLYHKNKLRVKINNGFLNIEGNKISVKEINSDFLNITGEFESIKYNY